MTSTTSPSSLYLLSLQSKTSKVTMGSILNTVAKKLQGVSSHLVCDWGQLSYEKVLILVNDMKDEGKSPSTINLYLAAIKGVAKASWMSKVIDVETYQWIKEVKRVKGTRSTKGRALNVEEVQTLINTCDGSISSLRDSALLALTYSAGLRRNELVNLQLGDLDISEGSISVMGKGNKQTINYVNDKAISTVQKWLDVRGNTKGNLFLRIRKGGKIVDKGITGEAMANIVCKRYKDAELKRISSHDLRRSFATNLLESGVDVFVVSKLMRHAEIATTRTYDMRGEGSAIDAAKSLSF